MWKNKISSEGPSDHRGESKFQCMQVAEGTGGQNHGQELFLNEGAAIAGRAVYCDYAIHIHEKEVRMGEGNEWE